MHNLLAIFHAKRVFLLTILTLLAFTISTADYLTTVYVLETNKNSCTVQELGILYYYVGVNGQYVFRTLVYFMLIFFIDLVVRVRNEYMLLFFLLVLLLGFYGNALAVANNIAVIVSCNAVQNQEQFLTIKFAMLYISTLAVWGSQRNDC